MNGGWQSGVLCAAVVKIRLLIWLTNLVFQAEQSTTICKFYLSRIQLKSSEVVTKINAQKFESSFYSNPDLRNVRAPADPQPTIDVALLIQQLQNSPELANTLAALLPRIR